MFACQAGHAGGSDRPEPAPDNIAEGEDSVTGGKIWHDIEVLFAGYADVKI
jgi:hypothetical protein